jgi:hypothetical protein
LDPDPDPNPSINKQKSMYLQNVIRKKNFEKDKLDFFVAILSLTDEKSRRGIGIRLSVVLVTASLFLEDSLLCQLFNN